MWALCTLRIAGNREHFTRSGRTSKALQRCCIRVRSVFGQTTPPKFVGRCESPSENTVPTAYPINQSKPHPAFDIGTNVGGGGDRPEKTVSPSHTHTRARKHSQYWPCAILRNRNSHGGLRIPGTIRAGGAVARVELGSKKNRYTYRPTFVCVCVCAGKKACARDARRTYETFM